MNASVKRPASGWAAGSFAKGAAVSVLLHGGLGVSAYVLADAMGAFTLGKQASYTSEPIEIELAAPTPPQPEAQVAPQPTPEPPQTKPVQLAMAPQPSEFAADPAPAQSAAPPPPPPAAPSPPQGGAMLGQQGARPAISPRERDAYLGTLIAWLNRHKTYPAEARRARVEGVVVVRFAIGEGGEILSSSIVRGSGHPLLDDAALDVFRRANPAPRLPESWGRGPITLSVPIEYSLITK